MWDLEQWYAEYNQRYFDGGLPLIPVRWGEVEPDHAAEFLPDALEIVVRHEVKDCGFERYARLLLLHEMVHVKLRNKRIADHGRIFHLEMLRLAQIGAFKKLW